jgi:hypothetical protein
MMSCGRGTGTIPTRVSSVAGTMTGLVGNNVGGMGAYLLTGARWLYVVPGNLVGISINMLIYSPRISSHLRALLPASVTEGVNS